MKKKCENVQKIKEGRVYVVQKSKFEIKLGKSEIKGKIMVYHYTNFVVETNTWFLRRVRPVR